MGRKWSASSLGKQATLDRCRATLFTTFALNKLADLRVFVSRSPSRWRSVAGIPPGLGPSTPISHKIRQLQGLGKLVVQAGHLT